jgi:hypothetical protein
VIIRNMVLCNMTACGLADGFPTVRRNVVPQSSEYKSKIYPYPEDGGRTFLQNFCIHNYRMPHIRKQCLYTKRVLLYQLPLGSLSLTVEGI